MNYNDLEKQKKLNNFGGTLSKNELIVEGTTRTAGTADTT